MIVEAFTPHHHWRICYQLISEPIGKTFSCYIGVLENGETHMDFSPTAYRGGGRQIPDARKQKVTYSEAVERLGWRINQLEEAGYTWRQ